MDGDGPVADLMQQVGHANLETTQPHAAALSERRRETVVAMEFSAAGKGAKPQATGRRRSA